MSDELKSAWELAREKLEAQESDPVQRLSDEQKEQIAELRRRYQARIAETEIGIQSSIRKAAQEGALDKIEGLQKQLVEERRTLQQELEEKVAEVRN